MQLKDSQGVRLLGDRLLDVFGITVEDFLAAWDYFCEDREAVAGRGLGKDGSVTPLLDLVLEVPPLGDRHGGGLRPVFLLRSV